MIQATNIHKTYKDLEVLKGVSVNVAKGEIVSIVGASGAGKTTLLHILGTLDSPDANKPSSLVINGTDILSLSSKALAKFRNEHIGFIFQFHQLLPEFTALENICIPALIRGIGKKEAEKRAMELLEFLHLTSRADHKPNALSGGEQQRVSVARALVNYPSVVFADEPSGNLDSESAEKLHQLFFQLRNEFRQTFVIVTHNEELATMADRKLVMVDGRIMTRDEWRETKNKILIKNYFYYERECFKEKESYFCCKDCKSLCGTAIGAMICEAERSESTPDFIHKLKIAEKEANETLYWLELLKETQYITQTEYNSINDNTIELIKMLVSSIKTARANYKQQQNSSFVICHS